MVKLESKNLFSSAWAFFGIDAKILIVVFFFLLLFSTSLSSSFSCSSIALTLLKPGPLNYPSGKLKISFYYEGVPVSNSSSSSSKALSSLTLLRSSSSLLLVSIFSPLTNSLLDS
jgi:hypothetical protein